MVMRCPGCSHTELVLVEIEHHLHLTVRGLASIVLEPAPAQASAPGPDRPG
jgi:hypothetical protein